MIVSLMMAVPAFFARLAGAPDEPAVLLSREFFGRAYSMSNDGWVMTWASLALTFVLELLSLDAVRFVCRRKGGAKLYAQGVACNFINNAVLGPPLYELVSNRWMSQPFTPLGRAAMVLAVIWGHSIGYYCSHRWMHTKRMYWAHKFHHKFNVVVVPVTANAVSLAEYAIAYMAPFVAGAALLRPDRLSMFLAVAVVSLNNLLIHTPKLADASAKLVPWLFVSTADHLEHHKRLTAHYAAPTFSVDRILAYFVGQPESWGSKFDAAEQVDDAPIKAAPAPPAEAFPAGAGGEAYPVGAKAE
jgi:sterol desaturase/sphingolipid hydroxylase (fatty acid hydroxylase superfamily)